MSKLLGSDEVHDYLEQISGHGCAEVNRLIAEMDAGQVIAEITHLPYEQQQQILLELKQLMQVYESCET